MPWSAWQEPLTGSRQPDVIYLNWNANPATETLNNPPQSNLLAEWRGPSLEARLRGGVQYRVTPNWNSPENWNWFPPLLSTLVEGVDYTVRPGKDPYVDYDAYIEYEGPYVHTGWQFVPFALRYGWDLSDGQSAEGAIALAVNTTYPMAGGQPLPEWPGLSGIFGTTVSTDPGGTVLGVPADPGPVESLSVLVDLLSMTRTGEAEFAVFRVAFEWVYQRVVSARWRYWVPGDAAVRPLRQRQRDDGLGLSTLRQKACTSHQGTIRQKSYL